MYDHHSPLETLFAWQQSVPAADKPFEAAILFFLLQFFAVQVGFFHASRRHIPVVILIAWGMLTVALCAESVSEFLGYDIVFPAAFLGVVVGGLYGVLMRLHQVRRKKRGGTPPRS